MQPAMKRYTTSLKKNIPTNLQERENNVLYELSVTMILNKNDKRTLEDS